MKFSTLYFLLLFLDVSHILTYHMEKIKNVFHQNTQNFLSREYAGECLRWRFHLERFVN